MGKDISEKNIKNILKILRILRLKSNAFLNEVVIDLFKYLFLPFFNGVVFLDVCDVGGLPPEGVAEVGLAAAGLAVVVEAFRAPGLPAVLLPFVGGRTKAAAD